MKISRPLSSLAVLSALVLVLSPLRLGAQDLSFHEAGARAVALGGAFTARADDTSALFYNPAGLAFLDGLRIKTNLTFGKRSLSAVWPEGGRVFRSTPFEFGGAHAASWQPFKRVTLGVGLFSPYSFDSLWPAAWSGNTESLLARVRTLYFRSALAVEIVKGFAVSAGLDIVSSSLAWRHDIIFNLESYPLTKDQAVESRHALSGRGHGFVAGALWKIVPAVQIGARYQQSVGIDYSGANTFVIGTDFVYETVPDPYVGWRYVYSLLDLFYAPQQVTSRLTLPREVACGVALTPFPDLSLYVDVEWERWSEFGDWIIRSVNEGGDLNPAFTPVYQEFYGISPDYGTQGVALALKDTKKIKAGLEFRPARYLALRAGFARHQSSQAPADRSPVYPDLDRNIYSFGFGYEGPLFSIWGDDEKVSDLSFDLFLRYASATPGQSAFPGYEMTYDSNRLVVGVGVGFIF
jgi:long-chain fatty acid transport protein